MTEYDLDGNPHDLPSEREPVEIPREDDPVEIDFSGAGTPLQEPLEEPPSVPTQEDDGTTDQSDALEADWSQMPTDEVNLSDDQEPLNEMDSEEPRHEET